MTAARDALAARTASGGDRAYWPVPLVRAVVALAAGLAITFTPEHSAELGFWSFGLFALVAGVLTAWLTVRVLGRTRTAGLFLAQGVASVIAGAVGVGLATGGQHLHDLATFEFLVAVWAAITGLLELYASRLGDRAAREWLVVGALTALLALVYVIVPLDSVAAVGLFGAYAVITGVYLAIGAFSLKWAAAEPQADAPGDERAEAR